MERLPKGEANMWNALTSPDPEQASRYLAQGWWRRTTFLDDLADAARDRPDHPAIIAYEGGEHARTLSYAELATLVARFAGALRALGVAPGDVVVCYLPNLWMLSPLYLACSRIGAISSPVIPSLGARELAYVLRASQAKVCVTVDTFGDVDYAQRLAEVGGDVHRVVIGDAEATGAIEFTRHFVDTPWEEREPDDGSDALGPDDPALLLYTSGTTGRMKGVVHSQNTMYACVRASADSLELGPDDTVALPGYLTHMAGVTHAVYLPVHLGCGCVVWDTNTDMELLLSLIEKHRITFVYAPPGYVVNLLAAQRARHRDVPWLRQIVSGSAPIAPQLIADVRDAFGVPMRALWGMTENGAVTVTRADDPEGWAAYSDGRPVPWMELRLDLEPGDDAGPLLVRGASQCLGYLGQSELYRSCVDADGWFDTGDLARHDGRGGIRITGRRVDLITRASGQKVSTLEVEAVLLRHPNVGEVVLVGYPDPGVPGADLICAVVVPAGNTPTIEDLHGYLANEGMAKVLWPDRLIFVRLLPKNPLGKILRQPLRQRLEMAQAARS